MLPAGFKHAIPAREPPRTLALDCAAAVISITPFLVSAICWSHSVSGVGHGRSLAEIVGSNPAGGMEVCREYCVLSDRGVCDELITPPVESYRLWCVVVCNLEAS